MSEKVMPGCVEIDGPQVACFCDGSERVAYRTFGFSMGSAGKMEDLILAMNATVEKILDRSNVIMWRKRPSLSFNYLRGNRCVENDGYPKKEDYDRGEARISIRCRLACYPPLTDEEELCFGGVEEGEALPCIT